MCRSQESCISPTNITTVLWLVWELPRASRGFNIRRKMLERATFHLLFSEREVPWICSPLCCPCKHLWQHRVLQVQQTGPWVSVAVGQLHPLPLTPISGHSTSPCSPAAVLGPSLAGISALQSRVAWISSLCKSPGKRVGKSYLQAFLQLLQLFAHTIVFKRLWEVLGKSFHKGNQPQHWQEDVQTSSTWAPVLQGQWGHALEPSSPPMGFKNLFGKWKDHLQRSFT